MSSDVHYFSPTTPGAASFDEDVSDFVRLGRIGPLSGEAQMAAVGSGSVTLDDIDSTVGHLDDGILGLKQWYWNETTCPAGNQRVFTGYTFDRNYTRGDSLVQGAARLIDVTLMDPNAFLSFRVFAPASVDPTSSFVRPAEDTIERIAALLAVDFLSTTLFDLGYIPTTGAKPLDAHDYTGFKPFDVVNDIAQVSGWNPWVGYDETENKLFLWFDDWKTDGSDTVPYDSTLRLTNVDSEKDSTTLLVEKWPVENIDPSRVISAVWVMGKGKNVYRTRPATANTFGWRDAVMQAQFLSDEAKLEALGDRYLLDNSAEDHKIPVSVQVPAELVTAIHEGMRIEAHFTHCPSVAFDFTWCRILHRTVRRDIETSEFYWLDLELSPIPAPPCPDVDPTPEGFYPPLYAIPAYAPPVSYAPAYPPTDPYTHYINGGTSFPPAPTADHSMDNWGFPVLHDASASAQAPDGFLDTAWAGAGNRVVFIVAGLGTATAHVPKGPAWVTGATYQASLLVYTGVSWESVEDRSGQVPDTEQVFEITDDEFCIHAIRIEFGFFGDPGSGTRTIGYGGMDWVPA